MRRWILLLSLSLVLRGESNIDEDRRPFQWTPALRESARFMATQHALRVGLQTKTRDSLSGPFFKDWVRSYRGVGGWRDGDSTFTNYVAHPMQGAISGYIFVQNDSVASVEQFGASRTYWVSRAKAMGWSAAYSALFELGPFSEVSIGNVGLDPRHNGMVDFVVTPTLGTALMVGEDVLDKYVVLPIERRTQNRTLILIARSLLNPDRSLANLMRWKWPWHRDARPGLLFVHKQPKVLGGVGGAP